ncbi:hypothetical protein IKQ74_01860 [Candidatus Saccharibacteria bacterium]|jgi:hypothetical protein|nr:hypothetical protein [Candidatus Saccharibacteria bacterium]
MQKQKNTQLIVIGVLAFAILFMSIGFAAYSQKLNINGMATVGTNRWSVHFNPESYQLGEGSVEENSKVITDTAISYDITLKNPGDYYLFQIDVVNDGQYDAILDSIEMSELPPAEADYVSYTVTYDDFTFDHSQGHIAAALPTATGVNRKVAMVRVAYEPTDDHKVKPLEEPLELNLSAALNFSQAE